MPTYVYASDLLRLLVDRKTDVLLLSTSLPWRIREQLDAMPDLAVVVSTPSAIASAAKLDVHDGDAVLVLCDSVTLIAKERLPPPAPGVTPLLHVLLNASKLNEFTERHHVAILTAVKGRKRGRAGPPQGEEVRAPLEFFGLTKTATLAELKKARTRLVSLYHPDAVAQLGPRIRDVALEETKRINAAFDAARTLLTSR